VSEDTLRFQLEASLGAAYVIERELGGGGMSRVFVATEAALGRRVVIKVLPAETIAGVSVERFKREIQVAARTQHPHIVPLLTAGEAAGAPYFTMPFVEGETLRARLMRGDVLSLPDAVRVLREIASALAYAHDRGIVHRDIKPENVLLSSGAAMVTDFGIAKAVSVARTGAAESALTGVGTSLGTPAYIAPEQATGEGVDHRADIYAWGVVAYELLAGHHPFSDKLSAQQFIAAHIAEVPAPLLPELINRGMASGATAQSLSRLVMSTLEKDPAQRPQRASELVAQLSAVGTPSGGFAVDGRRRASPWAIAVAAAVIIVGSLVAVLVSRRHAAAATLDPKRVVVASFANHTGDASLDSYGAMAADWIARGLASAGSVDIAGTASELAARGTTAHAGDRPPTLRQLALDAGAGLVISGAYYRQGDTILFQADFTDAIADKLIQSVGPVGAPVARPLDAVGPLRQRVLGSLALMLDPGLAGLATVLHQPPDPAAYREYLAGEDVFYKDDNAALVHFARATKLDSSFVYPLLRTETIFANQWRMREADSVGKVIARHAAALTEYEQGYESYTEALVHGDPAANYAAAERMVRVAPNAAFPRYGLGIAAIVTGRPREADSIFHNLDPMSGVLRGRIYYYSNYSIALHALAAFDRELDMARRGERQYPGRLFLMVDEVMALAALGRTDEVAARVTTGTTMSDDIGRAPETLLRVAIHELRVHGHPNEAHALAVRWTPWLTTRARDSMLSQRERMEVAMALQAAEQWDLLQTLAESLTKAAPTDPFAAALVADAQALRGDRAGAQKIAMELATIKDAAGSAQRYEARSWIAAALGDSVTAFQLFKRAFQPGAIDGEAGHGTWLFDRMKGYAPLVEYLKPRG